MENKIKTIKTIGVVLIIISISLIAFFGIFKNTLNFKENIIPEFSYGMEFAGAREFKFVLDTNSKEAEVYVDEQGNVKGEVIKETSETEISLDATVNTEDNVAKEDSKNVDFNIEKRTIKANDDTVLNEKSFEATKAIIQKRLDKAQISEYNIRLDTINGDLILEIPDNDDTNLVYDLVIAQGKFEIIDAQNGIVLLDNNDIKKADAVYSADEGYQAFLQIQFIKESVDKLKAISNEYTEITNENGETEAKYVELKLDGNTILKTSFGVELSQGILQITMGNPTTNYEEFSKNYEAATYFANILNSGKTPNAYVVSSDLFVKSQITENMCMFAKIIFAIIILIVSIVLIVKYRYKGILAAVSAIGYIAIVILAIKYTNVVITLNSVLAFLVIVFVNYLFMIKFLNKQKTDSIKHALVESIKEINITIIPLWVVAIIFTFMVNATINSVGMVMFWGLFINIIYNFIITRALYV